MSIFPLRLLVIGALLTANSGLWSADALRTDEQILKSLKLPDGYEATVFAKPPDLGYPTSVSAAIDGTLFVAVDENGSIDQHRNTPEKPRGYVLRLRDTDGDGKADEFKRFAEMESPRGVIWDGPSGTAPGTLYVMYPPKLTAFTDTDGDGKADKQEDIVTGLGFDLGFRGADHTTNGCRLAIDGFIYIAVGDYGFTKAVAKDGTTLSMRGGGIVRVRPDGTGFEIISHGQRNIYDVAISPTLDLFTRDNTNDGGGWNVRLSHVPPGAHMGYPTLFKNFPEDIVQPLADFGGGSPCGALWIDEPGLQNGLYTVEWGSNAIMYHPLKPKGAGWAVDETAEGRGQVKWLGITRPTDMDVDAAGRIYITSWEGATFTYNGPNAGYVVRVVKKGAPKVEVPDLGKMNAAEVIALLRSDSAMIRLAAHRHLLRRNFADPFDALVALNGGNPGGRIPNGVFEIIDDKSATLAVRTAAMHTFSAFAGAVGGSGVGNAVLRLRESRGDTTMQEARATCVGNERTRAGEQFLSKPLSSENPRVRAAAITALRRLGKADAAPHILPLVADEDPIISHLAIGALRELKAAGPLLAALDSTDERVKPGALQALYGIHDPLVVDGLIQRLGRTGDSPVVSGDSPETAPTKRKPGSPTTNVATGATSAPAGGSPAGTGESPVLPARARGAFDLRRGILDALCRLANQDEPYTDPKTWWGTRPDTSGPVYKPVAWSESGKIEAALKAALDASPGEEASWLVKRMYLTKVSFPGLVELMLAKAGNDTAAKLTAIEGLFGQDDALPQPALAALGAIARNEQESPELRAKALRQLQRGSSHSNAFPVAVETFATLAGHDVGQPALAAVFQDFTRDAKNTKWLGDWAKLGSQASRLTGGPSASGGTPDIRALAQTVLVNLATSPLVKGKEKDAAKAAVEKAWAQPESAASLLGVIARTGAKDYAEQVKARLNDPNNAVAEAALFAFQKLGLKESAPAMQIGTLKYEDVFAAVQKGGDPALGKELYLRAGCIACHTVTPDEPVKGPVLSAVAKIYDRTALTESILKPNAKLAQGFETQWFKLSGEELEGFVTREAGDSLDVRNVAGQTVTLKKSIITGRGHRPHSMMPEGLMNAFTPVDLAHLLAYLESLRR